MYLIFRVSLYDFYSGIPHIFFDADMDPFNGIFPILVIHSPLFFLNLYSETWTTNHAMIRKILRSLKSVHLKHVFWCFGWFFTTWIRIPRFACLCNGFCLSEFKLKNCLIDTVLRINILAFCIRIRKNMQILGAKCQP